MEENSLKCRSEIRIIKTSSSLCAASDAIEYKTSASNALKIQNSKKRMVRCYRGRMSTDKGGHVFIYCVDHVSSNRLFVGEEFTKEKNVNVKTNQVFCV